MENDKFDKDAMKIIDYYIDNVTAPLMEPIGRMFELEGAPFMSSFRNRS